MACRLASGPRSASFIAVSMIAILCQGPAPGAAFEPRVQRKKKPPARQNVIRISKETTRITAPLDAEGYVDYVKAVNDRYAKGVTPRNNYEVVVRRVMALEGIPEKMRDAYFARIGVPVPKDDARFYRDFVGFTLNGNKDRTENERLQKEHRVLVSQPWKAAEHPEAAKWVAEYGRDLDRLVEGSKRARFYTPYLVGEPEKDAEPYPRMIAMLLPSVQQQREIARGLSIRAMGRVGRGDLDGAWRDLQAMHRVARHVARGFTLIETLVAIAIDTIAVRAEGHVLNSHRLTDEQAKRFLADLKSLPPLPPIADKLDAAERYMGLDAVGALARHGHKHGLLKMLKMIQALSDATGRPGPLFPVVARKDKDNAKPAEPAIDWNLVLVMLNKWYDRIVAAAREPDFGKRIARFKAIDQDLKKLAAATDARQLLGLVRTKGQAKAMGEKIGGVLLTLLLPALNAARGAEDRATAHRALIQLGFALEVHRRDNGSLPKSLAALAPRYVKKIVKDPLSGAALKYVVKTDKAFLLYSVGRNGVDDKGRNHEDAEREKGKRPDWDDLVVRVRK